MTTPTDVAAACLYCGQAGGQVKAGMSQGVQRYKCTFCQHRYIRDRQERGYPTELREQALQLHQQGMTDRQIARRLQVSHTSVAHWVRPDPVTETTSTPSPPPAVAAPSTEPSVEAGQETPGEESSPADENYLGWERATISDVARVAGVSTTTVSNFLNDKGHMREETRQRIEAAIDQLHFSPSALVRAIRNKRTHILGVFVFGIDNMDELMGRSLTVPLLAGFYKAADRLGYNILLYTGWLNDSKRASGLDFLNGNIDGLIWVFPPLHEPALGRIASAGLPVISVLSRQVPDPVGYICIDNLGAMRTLVSHLIAQGHRRIAFAGPLYVADFQERRDGYREALAQAGLPWSADWEATTSAEPFSVPLSEDPWQEHPYLPAVQRWLSQPDSPTAVVTASDVMAQILVGLIEKLGRRVPKDLAVCGFDDIIDARTIAGGLTTIHQPLRQIGEKAVERLVDLIGGASVSECRVTVPCSLVVRASTSRRRTGMGQKALQKTGG